MYPDMFDWNAETRLQLLARSFFDTLRLLF